MGSNNNVNVAIVDDDASSCRAVSRLLRAAGISSAAYESAETFLASGSCGEVDCLILDLQLGGMSGFELQRQLAARAEAPPIVFITAHDESESREQAERSGCIAYLRKMDSGDAIIAAVRRAIAFRMPESSAAAELSEIR